MVGHVGPIPELALLLLLCLLTSVCCLSFSPPQNSQQLVENATDVEQEDAVTKQWLEVEKNLKDFVDSGIKSVLPHLLKTSNEVDISPQCMGAFLTMIRKLRSLDRQVFRMLDASGRVAPGLLEGSLADLGNYDECLRITVTDDYSGAEQFRGQYCMVYSHPPLRPRPRIVRNTFQVVNFSLFDEKSVMRDILEGTPTFYTTNARTGICMPSACSVKDVHNMVRPVYKLGGMHARVEKCEVREDQVRLTKEDIAIICIIATIATPVVVATLLQFLIFVQRFYAEKESIRGPRIERFLTLSAYETAKKIFVVNPPKDEDTRRLQVFHGLRAFTVVWVVWVHHYAYNDVSVYSSARNTFDIVTYYKTQFFNNGFLAVDTFFFISGFFLAYIVGKRKSKSTNIFEIIMFIIQRWWRLVPMATMGICFLFLVRYAGDGPLWNELLGLELDKCRNNWWLLMLNAQNYLSDHDHLCLVPYWYISVDMQLYLIFLGLVILLYRKVLLSAFIMMSLCVGGILAVAVQVIINKYPPISLFVTVDHKFAKEQVVTTYFRPYSHFAPFCLGIAVAYVYIKHKDTKMNKTLQVLGWVAAVCCNTTILFCTKLWTGNDVPSELTSALYASCHRLGWGLGIAWLVYNCIYDRGGIVNDILSYKALVPISRLSYVIYLMHVPVVYHRMWTIRERIFINFGPQFYNGMGTFVCAFFVSLIATIFLERPLFFLKDLVFGATKESRPSDRESGPHDLPVRRKDSSMKEGFEPEHSFTFGEKSRQDNRMICNLPAVRL